MPRKRVAIVVAMSREVAPLLRSGRKVVRNGVKFFELEAAVVAVGGIGRQAAQRAAEAVVARYELGLLVSAGLAGATSASGKVGDVFRAETVIDADSGERFASVGGSGVVVTASAVSGEADKLELAAKWNADMVDMEASAVAQVAAARGIEFAAVKAVSDELSFIMPPVGDYVDQKGQFSTLRFTVFLVSHPRWWRAVRELNANSRLAVLKLSGALQHLIDQQSTAVEQGNAQGR